MRVSRQHLQPGMELAGDVLDHRGRQLLPAGTVLTLRAIKSFEIWGIATVDVIEVLAGEGAEFGATCAISAELSNELSSEEEERVRSRFRLVSLTHPAEQALLSQSLMRAQRQSLGNAGAARQPRRSH